MRRVGLVSYSLQYWLKLFAYRDEPHEGLSTLGFVEKCREADADVAQLFHNMIDDLDDDELAALRSRAADLDVALEVHGGGAQRPGYEQTLRQAAKLGVKVVGCSFGMLTRVRQPYTLTEWDQFLAACRARLDGLLAIAEPLGITIGVENHLDLTVEELRDLVTGMKRANVGVIFDIGNTVGTLDDPLDAVEILGPLTVATHYKDFAIEEVTRGFRFTMVPLGCGSLRLEEITSRLDPMVPEQVGFAIEMMNGQQFEVPWLEERFWNAYHPKPAREVAATLRHIRGQAIDITEHLAVDEVNALPHAAHLQLETDRAARCVAHLRALLANA